MEPDICPSPAWCTRNIVPFLPNSSNQITKVSHHEDFSLRKMLKRLKRLSPSFRRRKEIGKAEAQINQTEDQRDSPNIARPPTYSEPVIDTLQPKDLWEDAYNQLDKEQQQILLRTTNSPMSMDKKAGLKELINGIIKTTKVEYEAHRQKSDNTLRNTSRKIINTLLSYEEYISAAVGLDPTKHAASAWEVVSLGLKSSRNYHDARNALFDSSEYLAGVITECAFIERTLYGCGDLDTGPHVETAVIKLYKAILRYSAQILNSQKRSVGNKFSDCATAITGHPLTEFKTSVEKERENVRRWIETAGYLRRDREAEDILLKIESLKHHLEQPSLDDLDVVDEALYDNRVHEHEDSCLEGTRAEPISRLKDWAESDNGHLFWLNGMAGTGKSTIARTMATKFKEQGLLGATFFFKRGEGRRGEATYLISTIARQLAQKHEELAHEVSNAIKTDSEITSKLLGKQFEKLLYQPLLKLEGYQSTTIVIVIDALDECDNDEDIKLILSLLFRLREIQSVRLRVFLTSRPEPSVRECFEREADCQKLALHELPAPQIERDIREFLNSKLSAIRDKHTLPDEWPGTKSLERLVQITQPLFIFAATLCRFIGDEDWLPEERLTAVLQDKAMKSPVHMDRTYLPVLNQLHATKNKEEFELLLKEFQNIIGVIVLLAAPLSVVTLAQLTGIPGKKITNRLRRFHSVLRVPVDLEAPVCTLHDSFRDFLIHTESDFRINEENTHRQVALRCRLIMDTRLRHNICDLANYGVQRKNIDPQIIQQRLPADLQYSCCHWVHHLSQIGISESDESKILSFLQKRFLHWLEALALMGKISEAAGMIMRLEESTRKEGSVLSGFLYDATRFTLRNAYMAGIAPLQLYCSGIAFAPARSVIKRTFSSELSKQIQLLPAVMDSWNTSLRTLEGHLCSVRSVAFSPDGLTLASGSFDRTIKLWDTATGDCRQTLDDHSSTVNSVAFSGDGLTLASGSDDNTVKLWDTATGNCRHTLKDHSSSVRSIAFSPNGLTLASGSYDSTIKLWDTATGNCRQTLKDHSRSVNLVAFSPDGSNLASGSEDKTIKLWDTATGNCRQTLKDHSDWVRSVAFSPDGLFLVSSSEDKTIKLWHIRTGTHRMPKGRSRSVGSVAFSPDEVTIAYGSNDNTIKRWDTVTDIQETLKGHSLPVSSVAFSPNGLTLASGSHDKTIKLWDMATGAKPHTQRQVVEGRSSSVSSVVFSPNGLTLASGSDDNTIKLWDTATGRQWLTLKGHLRTVNSMAFSPNGLTLASGSDDYTINLWNIANGGQLKTLKGHSDCVRSVAFSPDRLTLASGSDDNTIKLWNTANDGQPKTLKGHLDCVRSVAFSPDGLTLASGSNDYTIKLWNTANGEQLHTLEGDSDFASSVAFSPDGHTLASGWDDNTIKLWDTATGNRYRTLYGHSDWVRSVAFSPDGLTLVSASDDNSIKLWSTVTNRQWQTLEGHSDSASSVGFSPDGLTPALDKAPGTSQISLSSNWVSLGGEKLIWLPAEYRSFVCQAVKDATLALGYEDGRVLVIRLRTHVI
ncbi:hypothetical protein N7505_004106 [Penicillium chrysogenum]|uniref:NACHT domain-containing protein n=1 Tax=Penicillium chrysogenum TaxID=5076 RepID=A0ABQ8WS33_PENCH|nr:hypothetical protein N7505_004106 [Penicillium chrysogenum]